MKEIKDKLKEWGSICRISNIMEDPLTYSHSDMLSFAKYYHESKLNNNEVLDLVSKPFTKKQLDDAMRKAKEYDEDINWE